MNRINREMPKHSQMVIKVCGMNNPDNIRDISALWPMLMGFIFYEPSPRYALELDPEVVRSLPVFTHPVGVFVDESTDNIKRIASRYGITTVQLHGAETPEQCKELKDAGYRVFKAIRVGSELDHMLISRYDGIADSFVFDTQTSRYGGSGKKFNWSLLENYPYVTPYLLSGGIGPDDVDCIVASMRPGMGGIDINSCFETTPGNKDVKKIIRFILSLRKFNEYEPSSEIVF